MFWLPCSIIPIQLFHPMTSCKPLPFKNWETWRKRGQTKHKRYYKNKRLSTCQWCHTWQFVLMNTIQQLKYRKCCRKLVAVDSCMLPPMALYLTQMQFSTEANLPEVIKDHVSRLVVQFSNWTVHRIINTVFAKETQNSHRLFAWKNKWNDCTSSIW